MYDLLCKIFGWYHYRVCFLYKNKEGMIVFTYYRTVGVSKRKDINNHRVIKKELGPVTNVSAVYKANLCNGSLLMEPTCYLGRWK